MLTIFQVCVIVVISLYSSLVLAEDYAKLNQAVPSTIDVLSIAPVFDFDGDGCYPSAGISRTGDMNPGLKPSGSLSGSCSSTNFMETSNTVQRYACKVTDATYCGHFYALYFEKDQLFPGIESGHKHDWEWVAIWTRNGTVTHGTHSYHRTAVTTATADVPKNAAGHLKYVYHKDGMSTHALRLAGGDEQAENPYNTFVTPDIISWYEFSGDGWDNSVMRTLLNNFNYVDANLPMADSNFLNNLNNYKPSGYPSFASSDLTTDDPGEEIVFFEYINNASGFCLDVSDKKMANGTNVLQWTCGDKKWQKWYYESSSKLIRSMEDVRYCLDNGGKFENGANIQIWTCDRNNKNQKFVFNSDGSIGMDQDTNQVLDGYGTEEGDDVGTWWNWGGVNQRWTLR